MGRRFQIGDRVVLNAGYRYMSLPADMAGTVVGFSGDISYAVDFDDWENGHDCDGLARPGHGWYIQDSRLDPEITSGQ